MTIFRSNVIPRHHIEQVIIELLDQDPWATILPDMVHQAMIKKGQCCGHYSLIMNEIAIVTAKYHQNHHISPSKTIDYINHLFEEYQTLENLSSFLPNATYGI